MRPNAELAASFVFFFLLLLVHAMATAVAGSGEWRVLQSSIGVSAMHMQLLHNDRVIVFDRTDAGSSNLSLPAGRCLGGDCTAHSAEYDVAANSFRPLTILSDTWCSSATVAPDGALVQTGGYKNGNRTARVFHPCDDNTCDWKENAGALAVGRWYATNQILPGGHAVIVGGRQQFTYEFFPKSNPTYSAILDLPFLRETKDAVEDNLYPFVHLNIDGNLFLFANNRAILLDYASNAVVRTYPPMPSSAPRNYPSSGSSVLLPLKPSPTEAEVLVCGGAPAGAYLDALKNKVFRRALDTCGRIKITDKAPAWSMETMPGPRVMGDMVLLPSGEVLLINGAATGTAGWELGSQPVLSPVVYQSEGPAMARFEVQNATATPRMYHSSSVLLRDGRVLVGGSNPHRRYSFYGEEYPTELSLEAFSPAYLSPENKLLRPLIVTPQGPLIVTPQGTIELRYGGKFTLRYKVGLAAQKGRVEVTMVAPAFATHSFSMNQRLLFLKAEARAANGGGYEVVAVAPASGILAPPGYYMVFVVNGGIPSEGIWAHIE